MTLLTRTRTKMYLYRYFVRARLRFGPILAAQLSWSPHSGTHKAWSWECRRLLSQDCFTGSLAPWRLISRANDVRFIGNWIKSLSPFWAWTRYLAVLGLRQRKHAMPARQFCVAAGVYTLPVIVCKYQIWWGAAIVWIFLIDLESSRSTVLILFLKLLTVHKLNII